MLSRPTQPLRSDSVARAKVAAGEGRLDRAALLVVNPPYGFEAQMLAAAALLAPRLEAQIALAWVAGSE